MQARMLKALEFDKVKAQLLEHVSSSLGREKVERLVPSSDFVQVVQWQEETDEAVLALRLRGYAPLGGIFDIRSSLKRAKIGGTLSAHELLDIASTIYASRQMKQFIDALNDEKEGILHLLQYAQQMVALPEVEQAIKRCIDDHGEVLDHASDRLRSIRQQLRTTEARVRERLESMIRSSSAQKMLSDAIITIRNDRYVIPVKQEYRHAYGGIVHDQSSSGATLFIEPQVVVDLNNQLQEARVKEKQEIERILIELTTKVAEHADVLLANVDCLAELDFIFAKAKYAKKNKRSKTENEP